MEFLVIGVPYFGPYLLVVALTVRYVAPRSRWMELLYFLLGVAIGWWTQSALRQYGESHAGSFIDRNANVVEYLVPMFVSIGAVIAISSLFRRVPAT
jgi:hypothetical protein